MPNQPGGLQMITLTIPEIGDGELLFKEELEITEKDISRLRRESKGEGEISLLLSRKNMVAVRKPRPKNLIAYLLEQKQRLSTDIDEEVKKGYDFYHIALICSFLPDPACKFTWARLTITMHCESKQGDEEVQEKPIVCDMFPDEIYNEVKIERKFNVSMGLKYKFFEFKGESGIKCDFIIYQPEIIAVGRDGNILYWDFKESARKSICGDKMLFAIIKKPKEYKVIGHFEVSARVKRIIAKTKKVVEVPYEIC